MTYLVIASAVLLFGYLSVMAWRHGIPQMVSDTYYQLGDNGCIFSGILSVVAMAMMIALLDLGMGIQFFAFVGCAGLVFVGMAPRYLLECEYMVHKSAAITAALGCVAWCLSVNAMPTLLLAGAFCAYLLWLKGEGKEGHPWYWAECSCFADVFLTYWVA